MITVTSAVAWTLMCCGLTALGVSLAWVRPLHEARTDADDLGDALLDEIAAHRATAAAHVKCCNDLRCKGVSGTDRHLKRVK